MTRVRMPVNQTAVASGQMRTMTVMGHHAPPQPGVPRVTFAHPAAPVVMAPAAVSQAPLSASPVVILMVPGQPGRAVASRASRGVTDAGTGSTVPGGMVPVRGGGHAGFTF